MVNLAIIDDGINDSKFNVGVIGENIVVDDKGNVFRNVKDIKNIVDEESHGSVCAAILNQYNEHIRIINIVLLRGTQSSYISIETLMKALELCLELQIEILHLSLCTDEYSYFFPLLDIINKIYKKGVVIVAAVGVEEQIAIPAYYSNVIGVMYSPFVRGSKHRIVTGTIAGINVIADNQEWIVKKDGEIIRVGGQSSYVVPYICAKIAHDLNCGICSCNEIYRRYRQGEEKGFDWITKPYIFILEHEKTNLFKEFIVFDEYKVIEIVFEKPSQGILCLQDYIQKLQCGDEVILIDCTNENWENITIDKNLFKDLSIGLFVENESLINSIVTCTLSRIFSLFKLTKRVLIQNKAIDNVDIKWKIYYDENEVRDMLINVSSSLLMSCERIHLLYGIEYLPYKLLKSTKQLYQYIITMAYIYRKNTVYILVRGI